ncbi:hypothetical protein REPUB_Repub09cG0053000 [Reevesia pubescens]
MEFQGYGLRDNPKKSWKSLGFADDGTGTTSSMLMFKCKACGKEFGSMKALFGHMRHHSGRERKGVHCQECGRKFQSLKALTGHMRLHPVKLRVSVEIEQEVEDAALCLIMLSRGVSNWSDFNSFWEPCDNNSENNSLHQNKEIMQNSFLDGDESFQMKKPRVDMSDSDVSASMNVFYEKNISECKELDYGTMIDKEKKVGSEAPNDMLYRGVEFRVSKVVDESGFELYHSEIEERISGEIMNFRSVEVEPGQDLMEGSDLVGLGSTKSSSCKDPMFDVCDAEPGGDSLNKLLSTPLNSEMSDDSHKKTKYKCKVCNKTFKSHQALGGHQTIHRKGNSCAVDQIKNCEKITQSNSSPEIEANGKLEKVEYVENSSEHEMNGVTSYGTRVYKVHECQICFKVFASGQALGGHKKSHNLKDSETSNKNPSKQLEFSKISDVIDLNLPARNNEEANGDIGFKSCRVGGDCKSEALLSLVAN